eukprot:TCALIF_09364-PA protein Name:"Protein of unknown function" AED:0.20 eAED:0.58 QI:0/0/0.5/1/1/1/2/16/158
MCWESIVDWFKNAWSQIYCLIGTISNWLVDCVFQIQNVTMSIFVVIEFLVGAFLFALFLLALWIVGKILRFIWYCTGFILDQSTLTYRIDTTIETCWLTIIPREQIATLVHLLIQPIVQCWSRDREPLLRVGTTKMTRLIKHTTLTKNRSLASRRTLK